MIRKIAVLAIAVAAAGFAMSSAEAGGTSGAKKSSTIRVKNYSEAVGDDVVAFLVPNGTPAPTSQAQVQALGAKVIAANGGVVSLPVAPGAGFLGAFYLLDAADPFIGTGNYNVIRGGLKGYMGVDGASGAAPTILVGPAAGGPF